ncbi:MAG: feruloyl-CoA synthase [Acidimicrobiia bacterium]|nr:MAG: feruloyl-CoA synthase [Acidimicrobiia bacterium]
MPAFEGSLHRPTERSIPIAIRGLLAKPGTANIGVPRRGCSTTKPPFIDLEFAPAAVNTGPAPDGGLILSSPMPLAPSPLSVGEVLHRWARTAPERPFLAERDGEAWRTVTYAGAADAVQRLGQAMLERGVDAEHPVMLLSGNAIDNALVQLAAMEIGVPAAPISPAYSLMSRDYATLRYVFELLTPGLVYAADGSVFEGGLAALDPERVVVSGNPRAGHEQLDDLLGTSPGSAVVQAAAAVGPDTIAKILFTSGSTGMPKGVKNTQRMLCSNQQAIVQVWPFLRSRPPVVVDWLPWSHTFGSNHNFNMILFNGGTLYIDGGKPVPGLFETSVRNLSDVATTMYFNVPAGYAMLIPHLQRDRTLRERFFQDLDVLFYAAAALPQPLWEELEELSIAVRGARVRMLSAWGSTETAPMATTVHFTIERAGVIGLPAPGTDIKLTPVGDKQELRVRGPNVTPGYWRQDELTAEVFDGEGFFKMGDAGKLAASNDPTRGILFDGRIAENFKLASGTWVHTGELRIAVVAACAPVVQDAVLTGHDRDEIGLLVFPNLAACRDLVRGADESTTAALLVSASEVHDVITAGLRGHNEHNPGRSRHIGRVLIMAEPPSIDANEITDKGNLNQRAVLDRRLDLVERLYAGDGPDVVTLADESEERST